jgi:CheY-like chemotaxis protein
MELNVQVIREILRTFFTITDITVATNGQEAVEKLKTGAFDLVLMDIQMPGMDGIEATRAIRADGNGVPIVAMSAHAFLDEIERARQAGMNDYLTKPVQRDHLDKLFRTLFPRSPGGQTPACPGHPETGSMEARIFQYFLATFDSREIADRLLRKTLESLHACSGELEKRIAGKDLTGLEATLHRVHGALLNCGLPDLGELAGQLYQRTRQGSVDLGGAEMTRLVTTLKNPQTSSPS